MQNNLIAGGRAPPPGCESPPVEGAEEAVLDAQQGSRSSPRRSALDASRLGVVDTDPSRRPSARIALSGRPSAWLVTGPAAK